MVVCRANTRPGNLGVVRPMEVTMRATRRRYLGLAGSLASVSLAGCRLPWETTDAWRQFRANARRSGHNPRATGPDTEGTVGWTVSRDGQALSGPVVADGAVYLNGPNVSALRVEDGRTAWQTRLPFPSGIAPLVGDDAVFAVSRRAAFAFDRADGQRRWNYVFGRRVANAPGFDGDTLYVGFRSARDPYEASLTAIDPATGERLWHAPVGRDNVLLFAPAIEGDLVAVGKEKVYALDATDGTERWTFDAPGVRFGTPVLAGEEAYVGATTADRTGMVFGLDATDGTERWRVETGLGAGTIGFDGDRVYATSDEVYALDPADGTVRWRHDSEAFVHSPPSVAGGTVYLGGLFGDVVALDAADGTERWRVRTDGTFLSPPSIVGESLYVAGRNGVAYRIDGA